LDGIEDLDWEAGYRGELTETEYAQGRLPDRTYASRSFKIPWPTSQDFGQPARFVTKVFDADEETKAEPHGTEWIISETPAGRYQVKLLVAREAGRVKQLWIERVPSSTSGQIKVLLNLREPNVTRLIDLLSNLNRIPVDGPDTVRVDDSLIKELFANPQSLVTVYHKDPERFRRLISDDESARDVVAAEYRRSQVRYFRRLLEDDDYFAFEVDRLDRGSGPEAVWQNFFESNPWIFGLNLAGQLLTSWSDRRLEQIVAGRSISGPGKRADALLRTSGRIRSMVFAEIKTHQAPLLGREYRPGCWSPSDHLSGGVAQSQGTVHLAVRDIGDRLADLATDGSDLPGSFTYMIRPRSYLVIGTLSELVGEAGGDHRDKIRSFELFRRNLYEPEVITFDELLARAEWYVPPREGGDQRSAAGP
jgi:hypothetical protein